MASTSAVLVAMPLTSATQKRLPNSKASFKPGAVRVKAVTGSKSNGRSEVKASLKEKAPSLKNFLLSIVSGGVVLGVIVGAVIGVSNFDPVKRS
ncbi:hypothetical protein F0562_009720 [Nyssa sinensis]|uniref:Photosystem II reaction center X protein n=1 Tax=Nyssa sinensis TaxID=561372 RepID=A0A5J5A1U2_9ASTE|nr:hypothetical protein F0562_009720 [Nyssa sinensis]